MKWKYICLSAFLSAATANVAQAQFGAVHTIAHESQLNGETFFVEDMDLDGDKDMVLVTPNKELVLLRNDGTGHFESPQLVAEGLFEPVLLVDFNHDGAPDIVVRRANNMIGWMPNKGDGTFDAVIPICPAYFPIKIIDMNNDGEMDLFYAEYYPLNQLTKYYWVENYGNGIFINQHVFVAISDLQNIEFRDLRDVNNDGLPDFILIKYFDFSHQYWWEQGPDGTPIGPEHTLDTSYREYIDIDHDGYPDLVDYQSSPYPYVFQWRKNDGTGNYGPPKTLMSSLDGKLSQGDVDGDGVKDLIFLAENSRIAWGHVDANGDFTASNTNIKQLSPWVFADISGDGIGDFTFLNGAVINDGAGNFGEFYSYNEEVGFFYRATPGDADGDGDPDVLYNDGGKLEFGWYQNGGQGAFPEKNVAQTNFGGTTHMADFDADGFPDFIGGQTDTIQFLWRGGPGGNYDPADTIFRSQENVDIYRIADVDADGDPDCQMIYFPGSVGGWILNDGTAHFSEETYPNDIFNASADLDGDGLLDLVKQRNLPDYAMYWQKNLGGGNFGPEQTIGFYTWIRATADVDQDGDQDFIVSDELTFNGTPSYVNWLENTGNGTAWVEHPIANIYANLLIISDFNHDGSPDAFIGAPVSMSPDTTAFFWCANDGAGHFGEPVFIERMDNIYEITPADFDQDGDSDVFFSGPYRIGWFENFGADPLVKGRCYFDANANGKQDSTEAPLAGIKINLEPGGQTTFSGPDGSFRFYSKSGDFLLKAESADCFELSSVPAEYAVHLPLANADTLFSFGFKNKSTQPGVTASVAAAATRCGFKAPFWVSVQNTGCYPARAAVSLHVNDLATFVSADSLPALAQGDSILWKIGEWLQPGETRTIRTLFRMAGADHLGDSVRIVANTWLSDSSGNLVKLSATNYFASEINCAYDPNDKTVDRKVLPIEYDPANSELTYTIRFQNTGTDTAFNIRVLDTLSANLDWKSFRPRATSHPCTIDLDQSNGALEYRFNDILLADSTKNEPGSHGFISFSIRPRAALPPSTGIPNRAAIYFDYNAPVFTNTAETWVERLVPVLETPPGAWPIAVIPNPNAGVFSVQLPEIAQPGMNLRLVDLMGRLLLEQTLQTGVMRQTVRAGDLPSGLYFLQLVLDGKVLSSEKFVRE